VPDRPERRRLAILSVGLGAVIVLLLIVLLVPIGNSDPDAVVVGGHPLAGKAAPPIELQTLDGEPVSLAALRGRPVLVNFFATWCVPCRDELPLMAAAYDEHRADGLEILGIVHDDTVDGARAFAADMGATWPILSDPDDAAWLDYLGVAMPTSFFIDPDGVIRSASLGGFTEEGLDALLATILPTGAAASGAAGSPASGATMLDGDAAASSSA
jgi:cytochrome c biogenesis protein CcmG, thiol:disulfide interchange protein DsbE